MLESEEKHVYATTRRSFTRNLSVSGPVLTHGESEYGINIVTI